MDIDYFKKKAIKCELETDVDALCFSWLKSVAVEYGKTGTIASNLLDLVQNIIDE